MAFNGSGVFLRVKNWTNDALAGILIRADRHDQEDDNLANGLSQCITKDGQTTITANLPMAGFKHTNVGNASSRTEYASFGQLQDGVGFYYNTTGSSNAYVITTSPATTVYTEGQSFYIKPNFTNTGAATLNLNGLGAKALTKQGAVALVSGDVISGVIYSVSYDGTRFQITTASLPAVINATTLNVSGSSSLQNLNATTATFAGAVSINSSLAVTNTIFANGNLTVAGTTTINGVTQMVKTGPEIIFNDPTGGLNAKISRMGFTPTGAYIDFLNDAFSLANRPLALSRTGYTCTEAILETTTSGSIYLKNGNIRTTNGQVHFAQGSFNGTGTPAWIQQNFQLPAQ